MRTAKSLFVATILLSAATIAQANQSDRAVTSTIQTRFAKPSKQPSHMPSLELTFGRRTIHIQLPSEAQQAKQLALYSADGKPVLDRGAKGGMILIPVVSGNSARIISVPLPKNKADLAAWLTDGNREARTTTFRLWPNENAQWALDAVNAPRRATSTTLDALHQTPLLGVGGKTGGVLALKVGWVDNSSNQQIEAKSSIHVPFKMVKEDGVLRPQFAIQDRNWLSQEQLQDAKVVDNKNPYLELE